MPWEHVMIFWMVGRVIVDPSLGLQSPYKVVSLVLILVTFWRHCRGSQLIISIRRVNMIHLVNTITLYKIIFCSILFVVLIETLRQINHSF
jgi:hypothetical protein